MKPTYDDLVTAACAMRAAQREYFRLAKARADQTAMAKARGEAMRREAALDRMLTAAQHPQGSLIE